MPPEIPRPRRLSAEERAELAAILAEFRLARDRADADLRWDVKVLRRQLAAQESRRTATLRIA